MKGPRALAGARSGRPSLSAGLTVVALALLVATAGAAVWFGISWGRAQFVDRPAAEARAEVLAAAERAAVGLSTFDIANLDASYADIDAAITGELAEEFARNRSALTQVLMDRKASSSATVTASGVVRLDRDEGIAQAIVVMRQTTGPRDAPEESALVTVLLTLHNVDGTWLAARSEPLGNKSLDTPAAGDGGTSPDTESGSPTAPDLPTESATAGN